MCSGAQAALIDGPSGSILLNATTTTTLLNTAGGATGPNGSNALLDGFTDGTAGTFVEFHNPPPTISFSFNFDQAYDIGQFLLWNDRGQADSGIFNFGIDFFDISGMQVGATFTTAANPIFQGSNPTPETFIFGTTYTNVVRADLLVFDSLGVSQVQIREIAFDGQASVIPVPPAFLLFGSGLIGLIGMARSRS
jgi:hypothetical protein